MKRYDNAVLNKLLDSYESRKDYAAEHRAALNSGKITIADKEKDADAPAMKRGIFCRVDKKNFPDYYSNVTGAYEILHEQLDVLEQKGLIRLYWKSGVKGHILEKAELELSSVDDCYKYLGRRPLWKKEAEIIRICRKYSSLKELKSDDPHLTAIMFRFTDWISQRLENGESIKRFADIDDPDAFDRLCRLLISILTNDQDVYLRQFSIMVFSDSKIAERELERAVSVIKEFSGEAPACVTEDYSGYSSDEILEAFGIYRNPVWLYMKGCAGVMIDGNESEILELSALASGIGVTLHDLKLLRFDVKRSPECVLTVENLTSYYQQDTIVEGMRTLVIYIGGFAGRQKREFLKVIHDLFPDIKYMHSGDIDCGGFRIWKALCEGTGIPFETYNMGIDTFRQFFCSGRSLTNRDIKNLTAMKNDPFFAGQKELFDHMLETGIKIEQEVSGGRFS